MPRLAANLTMMFTEYPFMERFAAARACGFEGVEYLFPYDWPKEALAGALGGNGLEQVLFNLPPGDWAAGERGLAALPGRESEFMAGLEKALDYAEALGCTRLHAMAGIAACKEDLPAMTGVYIKNLARAAEKCASANVRLLIEPINDIDMPGYFLNTSAQAMDIIAQTGSDNLFLQYDIYHMQIMEGRLAASLDKLLAKIGHIQIAAVPGRHEPDSGEINYQWLLKHLDEAGYGGWTGCEYRPRGKTEEGLGWAAPWGIKCKTSRM
ncbi:MAG TPA: hydroxypyruvate isomerase family protein [Rhizobiales bacterium]|nr:hydroxypyruvate isomerase family protein [Hyphomicrobiales bacterium]